MVVYAPYGNRREAGDVTNWLKQDFELGHGHAMAIYALLKGIKNEDSV
ncbi:MAG: DUF4287 domain-containing protein [Mucilaginibacter sp.]